mgnify:CR=1 FL=1
MNIDDFLQENGFDKNETENDSCSDGAQSPRSSNDMDIKGIYIYIRFSLVLQILHFCSDLQLKKSCLDYQNLIIPPY